MRLFQHKKESVLIIGGFATGVTIIFFLLLSHLALPDSTLSFLGKNGQAELTPNKAITQVFVARQDNLSQLNIIISRGDLGIREKIHLALKDATCTTTLAEETLSWWTPDPFIYHHFPFETIRNSQGQQYCLSITYESTEKRADRPTLATNEGPAFKEVSYTDTGKERTYMGRSLIFRPAYTTGSLAGDLWQLIGRLSQYKPFFLKDVSLVATLTLFLLSTSLLIVFIGFHSPSETSETDIKKEA